MRTVHGQRREWVVGELLHAGGFGEIYRVPGERPAVVVKLVPKLPGAGRELLFADDLSGIRNVIPVLDTGESEDSWALVMPEAAMSLRDHLTAVSGPLDVDQSMKIMIDIAETLADLREKEIVHRDLKPENLLLRNDRWCLADFGISRYAEATTAPDTHKGSMSAPYAAPEQWRFQRATNATDVYALGVIGVELVTGSRPFPGPDFRDQHLHHEPPSLGELPAALAALLQGCLMKSAGSRPRPDEVLDRLHKLTSRRPVGDGHAALQEAYRVDVDRLSQESRDASQAQTAAESRDALLRDGDRQLSGIRAALRAAVEQAAPGRAASGLVRDFGSGERSHGWRLPLGSAELSFGPRSPAQAGMLPFDVIASCEITVTCPADRFGYTGRSHSLWFCDAAEQGRYRWYELAFMDSPLVTQGLRAVDPFAADPQGKEASEAIQRGLGVFQLGWPLIPVDPGDLDEFVDRWQRWFAEAATGRLTRPSQMPERPAPKNWRIS